MTDELDRNISAYWESEQTSSMNDRYVATLETEMLLRHIDVEDRVLDLGCGDGSGCRDYRVHCRKYVGMDRSQRMLAAFAASEAGVRLVRADLRCLPFSPHLMKDFTVIVTQRSLINLPDEESQEEVLRTLPEYLPAGGRLLVCEAFREGGENINALRQYLGFDHIPPRWHNVHLSRPLTERALKSQMKLVAEEDLSNYFYLTRVVNQALAGNVPLDWDRPFNRIAFEISRSGLAPDIKGFSHITLQVWQKR